MAERGYDAAILRNNPDLRWLTGAERTFDDGGRPYRLRDS